MQIIIQLFLEEIPYKCTDGFAFWGYCERTKFCLGLRLKHWLLYFNADCRNDAAPNIASLKILFGEVSDRFNHGFAKSSLMSAPLGCALSIDKGKIILPILIQMGKCHFDVISFDVYDLSLIHI